MSRYEDLDALEAPPEAYEPSLRVQMALEARLKACPACAGPLYTLESKRFTNDEGAGGTVKVHFLCDSGASLMVMPSGKVQLLRYQPCHNAMFRDMQRIAAEAGIFAGPTTSDLGRLG